MSDPRDEAGHAPLHTPYDPNYPTGGGNFNPNMKIDTSHVSVAPSYDQRNNPIVESPRHNLGSEDPPPAPNPGPVVTLQSGRGVGLLTMHQFRTAVDAWISGVPWETIDPATHNDAVKRGIGAIAGRYGLRMTWRNA